MASHDENARLLQEYSRYMLPVLSFRDIVITRGEGAYIWDANGTRILDLNSGQFCAVFGHSNPGIGELLGRITSKLQDTDTSTLSDDVLFAAKRMHDICEGMNGRVIFLSTGAEANECCLRYAKHIKEKPGVVAFDLGYHGLTHGTAAYSMSRARIRPTLEHSYVVRAPRAYYDDQLSDTEIEEYVAEFEQLVSANREHIAAAIFEPIISGGGMVFPPKRYFQRIREICTAHDVFLVFDECQTGFGRTGSWFYYQQLECVPDFLVCAKSMGLGFPVACVVANGNSITHELFAMMHYSSHQNEPVAAQIVSYAIDTMSDRDMLRANSEKGRYLLDALNRLARDYSIIADPRGKGLMCGFDLFVDGVQDYRDTGDLFCRHALENQVLLQHCNNGRTIRLLPNYVIGTEQIDELYTKLDSMLSRHYR